MSPPLKGTLFIATSSVLFAAMAVVARMLSGSLSPGQLTATRFLLGIVASLCVFAWRGRRPQVRRFWLWALRGIAGGLSAYLYFVSIAHLEVGPATVLNNLAPAFAALFAFFYLREALTFHSVTGLAVAMMGAGLVAYGTQDPTQTLHWGMGVWAGLASAALSGVAITVVRALRRDMDALTIFLSFCVFGLLWSAPFAAWDWRPLNLAIVGPAVLLGVLSIVAQLLYTEGLGYVPAGSGSAINLLMPALSWTAGVFWLGEHASWTGVAGAALTLAGVAWGSVVGPYLSKSPSKLEAPTSA